MLYEDRRRAESFGSEAARYDRVRPSYPAAMVDAVLEGGGRRVLDVGCGTGIAARLFRDRGCAVLGVEPDVRMAQVARADGLEVEIAHFEEWDAAGRAFDVVVSGQAWHWVDPLAGARKAAAVLDAEGSIALFWNVGRPPAELRAALDDVYQHVAPGLDEHSIVLGRGSNERFDVAEDGLRRSRSFVDVAWRAFEWSRRYTTAEWVDHLPSHSDHAALPELQLDRLLAGVTAALDALGGGFTMSYDTHLLTARKA